MTLDSQKPGIIGQKEVGTSVTDKRTNLLRTALGGALLMVASGLPGCKQKPVDIAPQEEATAKTSTPTPAPTSAPTAANTVSPLIPSGEEAPINPESSEALLKYIFENKSGYKSMDLGGTRAFAHFPRNNMRIVVRASSDAEVAPETVTQVKCNVEGTEYTNLWISTDKGWYTMLDCNLPQIQDCTTLKDALPKLLTEAQKKNMTYVDRNTYKQPFPEDTVFQIGQLRLGGKPGCDTATPVATAPNPSPRYTPTVPSTPAPGNFVTLDTYKKDKAAQAKIDNDQNIQIDSTNLRLTTLAERIKCYNADGTMKPPCAEALQAMSNQGSATAKSNQEK